MKFRAVSVIVLVALGFVLSAFVPLAAADYDGMHVILISPSGQYKGGDKAKVEVQVFEKEKLTDPDSTPVIEFSTGYGYGDSNSRDVTMTKKETGIYTADIDIYDSDIDRSSFGYFMLKAQGNTSNYKQYGLTYGKADSADTAFDFVNPYEASGQIYFVTEQGLKIKFDFKNLNEAPWGPGEKVKFDIRVTDDGKPIKPDEFKVGEDSIYVDDDDIYYARAPVMEEDPTVNVLYQNPSDGYYQAEFTIPALTEEHSFDIQAMAKKGDITTYNSFSVDVNMFSVWGHVKSALTSTDKDFDIWVADQDGMKVSGAAISFDYYSGGFYGYSTRAFTYGEKNGTTDSEGKCSFSFTDITSDLYVMGDVKKDGKTQVFSGTIDYSDGSTPGEQEVEPDDYGFDVITQQDIYKATGSQVTHPFEAYYDGEALKSKDIYYYVSSSSQVLGYGVAKTDTKGEFNVNFKKPDEELTSVNVEFECPINHHPGVFVGYGWEDSDFDGFSDKFEEYKDTDPKDSSDYPNSYKDSDGDEFGDQYEEFMKTDPNDESDFPTDFNDTDSDGFGNEFEIDQGTDPDDRWDHPSDYPDDDYDGHSNDEETFYGTDPDDGEDYPHNSYTENSDGDYVYSGWWDTDAQYDGEEQFYGTDPEDESDYPQDIYGTDSDYDGVKDEEEKFYGTDPDDWYDSPKAEPSPWDERYSDHNSTDGWKYEEDAEYLSPDVDIMDYLQDDKVVVSVNKFNIGGRSTVTISTEDKNAEAGGTWYMGDIGEVTDFDFEPETDWDPWCTFDTEFYPVGSSYSSVIVAPEFLPAGSQKYSIIGGYYGYDGVHYNYVVVRDGESATSAPEDDTILGMEPTVFMAVSISAVALLIIIIIVVIVVIVIVKGKKKAPAANPTPAPAPAPAGDNLPPPPPPGIGTTQTPPPAPPGQTPPPAQPGAATPPASPQTQAPPPDPSLAPQGQTGAPQQGQPYVMQQGNAYPPPPPPKQY